MCQIDSIVTGLTISVGHGHWSDPFVKLSDVVRKPPDILSDKSETGQGLLFVRPECIGVRPNCSFVQRKSIRSKARMVNGK